MDNNQNHLIERFPRGLQKRFLQRCERFELVPKNELGAYGEVLTHAYFPCSGAIVLMIDVLGRPSIEVGNVGSECMLGSELLQGPMQSPWRALVQVAGSCWRIEAGALRQAMDDMPQLLSSLQHNFIVQVHQRQAMAWPKAGYLQRETQNASKRSLWQHGSQVFQAVHIATFGTRSPAATATREPCSRSEVPPGHEMLRNPA